MVMGLNDMVQTMAPTARQFFRRKWRISIIPKPGTSISQLSSLPGSAETGVMQSALEGAMVISSSDQGDNALRCTFNLVANRDIPTYGDITIYNLNRETSDYLVQAGARVVVEAGYMNNEKFGTIWNAPIYQFIRARENSIDYTLTFRTARGLEFVSDNFVSSKMSSGMDKRSIIQKVADDSLNPISMGRVSPLFDEMVFPRGWVFFGKPLELFRYIGESGEDRNIIFTYDDKDGSISSQDFIEETTMDSPIIVSVKTGLIGTPAQTNYGVSFRSLLRPEFIFSTPCQKAKLELEDIRVMKVSIGQTPIQPLNADGTYSIISVTHIGDTRGNDWYSEIEGWTNPTQVLGGLENSLTFNRQKKAFN